MSCKSAAMMEIWERRMGASYPNRLLLVTRELPDIVEFRLGLAYRSGRSPAGVVAHSIEGLLMADLGQGDLAPIIDGLLANNWVTPFGVNCEGPALEASTEAINQAFDSFEEKVGSLGSHRQLLIESSLAAVKLWLGVMPTRCVEGIRGLSAKPGRLS